MATDTLLTYKCMVEKLGSYGEFEAMENIVAEMREEFDNRWLEGVYISVMRNYGRKRKIQEAINVLRGWIFIIGCEFNSVAYCTVISGFYEGDYRMEAYGLFDQMLRLGIVPNVATFNIYIHFNSKVVEAENYMNKMVNSGLKPDAFTYNTIIDGYCKLNMVQKADKILLDAQFRGFVPDEFTYCSLVNGLCEDGDIDRAISIFSEASGKGIKALMLFSTHLDCDRTTIALTNDMKDAQNTLQKSCIGGPIFNVKYRPCAPKSRCSVYIRVCASRPLPISTIHVSRA
ncbi:UNVERIFIED_CONTAM: putative pentatricopeptide repeat-containing protein [Sesamum calycinum]|uniref:Pentatricopeptide repeat-containing protein n=1 Tax=Sesamum calycinum TaxID=2727403 RepID=A0AAW2STS7_9LAMI